MSDLLAENVALVAEVADLRLNLIQACREIAALEQALEEQRPALDAAWEKITKHRLEIVELLDTLAKVG